VASWGGALDRVARLGDGWVASALHSTPEAFGRHWARLRELAPDGFGNIVATLFFYVGDDAERVVSERLAPLLGKRPEDLIPHCALGSPDQVRERIQAFADAGAQQIQLWPAADPVTQIAALAELALASVDR
jgi:alkanesulfonate monooxygenase SsuD/methylene tetrahydromethanopterin reductase-like flavin-dependent oxidoreductase (luciferase family)